MLIGDEPEEGMENLMEVEIPEDVEEKLKKADTKEEEELEEEKKKNSDSEGTDKGQETPTGLIRFL